MTSAVSLSVMVTVSELAAPIVISASPLVILVSVTVTDSLSSSNESSSTATSIVAEVVLARMVTVPVSAV